MKRDDIVLCFRIVNGLLHADGKLTEAEQDFLREAMDRMEFTAEERVVATTRMDWSQTRSAVVELSPELRRGLIEALIEGSLADRHLDDEERAFIERVGQSMDMPGDELDAIWQRVLRLVLAQHKVEKGYYG